MALLFSMPGNEAFGSRLAVAADLREGRIETRRFPDGESYVRILSPVSGETAYLLCTLPRPDEQILMLLFAVRALREQGAASVGLIAPYLAYLRQDFIFHPGETVTSRHFAEFISREFDQLLTVDPHLHRYRNLNDIYTIPAVALSAAPAIAGWIGRRVSKPLLIGPDAESERWVADVARLAKAPFVLFRKQREGDRKVVLHSPDLNQHLDRQPVIVDDIASSGHTLIEAAELLHGNGLQKPICAVVHALFEQGALELLRSFATAVVSTDTVGHQTSIITIIDILAAELKGQHPEVDRHRSAAAPSAAPASASAASCRTRHKLGRSQ